MTSGRSPYADDPDRVRYGPGASPVYGPPSTPTYGTPATPPDHGAPAYGPSATAPTYGPSATAPYGPPAAAPAYGPTGTGVWPGPDPWPGPDSWRSPDPYPATPAPAWDATPGTGWSPAPIEPVARAARPRRRGQWLAWTVLVLALLVSVALGVCVYGALATVRISAADPLGAAWGWVVVCGGAALAAVGVFLLGLLAVAVSRPKVVAVLATLVALVLPLVTLYYSLSFGLEVAARHAAMDAGTLVDLLSGGVDRLGAAAGPVGQVLEWVLRLVSAGL